MVITDAKYIFRDKTTEIFPYTCDPDTFYLPMYEDGEFQMYIDRTPFRF